MGCLGAHFALDDRSMRKLRSFKSKQELLDYFIDEVEEDYFNTQSEWLAETDKSWDAIHRSLTDGQFGWNNGTYPLNHVIMGGERMYDGDDYILVLKTPHQIRDVATALAPLTRKQLRQGYSLINTENCDWEPSEEDFEYVWSFFPPLQQFFARAAAAERFVVFSADQ